MVRSTLKIMAIPLCATIWPAAVQAQTIQYFPATPGAKPFSAAVRIGNTVYTSGAIGVASDGTLPTSFDAQAVNAMRAVSTELKMAGASVGDVYRCNVLLADMKNWSAFNAVYARLFVPGRLPVRTASGAQGLARGAAVEVDCDAYIPEGRQSAR